MIDLEIYQLRSLLAVVEYGSMSLAAQKVLLTQGAVSIQIKRLEETINAKIFRRSGRNLVLTEAGETLVRYAKQIVELNDRAYRHFAGDGKQQQVMLGITTDVAHPFLSKILHEISELHPDVKIRPHFNNSIDLLREFHLGNLDFIVTADVSGQGIEIARTTAGWYGSGDNEVAKIRPLPVITGDNPSVRKLISYALESANIPYEFMPSAADILTSAALVNAGLGVTVTLDKLITNPQFKRVEKGLLPELPTHGIYIYYDENDASPILKDLEKITRKIYRDFFGKS